MIGRTQDDAMAKMQDALRADGQRNPAYQNATCQPARVGCKQDANGYRCHVRQTCCRGEAPSGGNSGGKVCKRIKFVASAKPDSNVAQTRQVVSGHARWGLAAESAEVQQRFGLTNCEQAKVECTNPTGNVGDDVCTATSKCCNQ